MQRSSRIRLGVTALSVAIQFCAAGAFARQAPGEVSTTYGPAKTIVLPDEVPAGESATLSVLDAEGRLVPGSVVGISGGTQVTTDASGRAMFIAPPQAGTMLAQLPNGLTFMAEVAAVRANRATFTRASLLALADRFSLRGPGLSPDAKRIRVVLGGQEAFVLASSSVSLVALPNPRTPLGDTELAIEVAGRNVLRAHATVVSLAVVGPATGLAKGQKGVLQVTVSGTGAKLFVEVRNLSPLVLMFSRGDVARVKTSGGSNNIAKIEVVGMQPGDYEVSARFVNTEEPAH